MKPHRLSLLLALGLSASALAQVCPRPGYAYGYGYRPFGGIYSPYHGWAGATATPYASRARTDEDLYQGAKGKGDRYMADNRYSDAIGEYENAARRATRFWGGEARQTKAALVLATQARQAFERYGDAKEPGSYRRAQDRGDRHFARREYSEATAEYQAALGHAHTEDQAKQAAADLVKAQTAASGGPAHGVARLDPAQLEATGDRALAKGRLDDAASAYAAALTSARRRGADEVLRAALTAKLTDTQRRLARRSTASDTD